ncbi:A24 family peptidase [Roseovarius phycicola]|uniref:Prepilin peptidase n=1 Tax=Roseovarius phycicola TaxID=3080976 RepID=A0ABZ2HFH3_9RHOB
MQIDAVQATLFALFAVPLCILTFYVDMKYKRITNLTVWAVFLVFVIIGFFTLPFTDFLWRFAHYAVAFVYGFVLWMARQMGAGDVKFMAAAAPYVHPGDIVTVLFILAAACFGSALAVLGVYKSPLTKLAPDWASWAAKNPKNTDSVGKGQKFTIPFGTALGLTLACYLVVGAIWGQ